MQEAFGWVISSEDHLHLNSHQGFKVKSLRLISERLLHFKELEIQVKVIVRMADAPH